MTSSSQPIVVGGGIGGLAAAVALSRQGVQVRVYERASQFGEVGAGMQLAPNCTRILAAYGLLDEVRALGVCPELMVMKDALDASELTRLDLADVERRYGFPYLVIHRSDLHGVLLRAAQAQGVELITEAECTGYASDAEGAEVTFADGRTDRAPIVIAADGLRSVAREQFVGDHAVNSAYVAYRGAVPIDQARDNEVSETDVVVYVGPRCHMVQYPLRGGEMFNQVAVFESPKAVAGEEDWGTPDELEEAFVGTCTPIQLGLPLMWRDRWWRMFDRDPIDNWVYGRVMLLGDGAHPPLQYLAQGAIMAIEDGWVLGEQVARQRAGGRNLAQLDWAAALAAYNAVRPRHCRRVVETARSWGELWHVDGDRRQRRNAFLRSRDTYDYTYPDWIFGPTALTPEDEAPMYPIHDLDATERS